MKRVLFCAFLCMLLIGTVSAVNLTKIVVTATPQLVVKPGFHVTFQPNATHTLAIDEATITFESTPPGASIFIGGFQYGYVTPVTITMSYAPYVWPIIFTYPGYQNYTQTLNIQPQQTYTVSAVLIPITSMPTTQPTNPSVESIPANTPASTQQVQVQPISSGSAVSSSESTGSLSVTTTPAGAVVSVDNEAKGISPTMISGLAPGTHALKISKTGYQDFSTTISIEAGKVREYSTGLTAASIISATTPANSIGFPVFAAIIALIGLVIVRKRSR